MWWKARYKAGDSLPSTGALSHPLAPRRGKTHCMAPGHAPSPAPGLPHVRPRRQHPLLSFPASFRPRPVAGPGPKCRRSSFFRSPATEIVGRRQIASQVSHFSRTCDVSPHHLRHLVAHNHLKTSNLRKVICPKQGSPDFFRGKVLIKRRYYEGKVITLLS